MKQYEWFQLWIREVHISGCTTEFQSVILATLDSQPEYKSLSFPLLLFSNNGMVEN